MVSEAASGYISGLRIYTGKGPSDVLKDYVTLDLDCSRATKTAIDLLDKLQLLDTGSYAYFDNYY